MIENNFLFKKDFLKTFYIQNTTLHIRFAEVKK